MLNQPHFYNRTIRKVVVAFGTIFNEIYLQRYSKNGNTKFEISKVPLSYGPKEKYLTRITSDPNLTRSVNTVVPRISFELTGLSYDVSRKKQSTIQNFALDSEKKLSTQYMPVPYDFNFSLSIFVRNTEDGTQILEQILPSFRPDFTVTVDFIPEMDQKYDLPIILNSVNSSIDYEGDMLTTRLIIWELEFTVKGYIWPAVIKPAGGLIGAFSNVSGRYGQANTNIYIDTQSRTAQKVYLDYANGNNVFTTSETIRVTNKDITGKVFYFSNNSLGVLIVEDLNKLLSPNDIVVGDYSNAHYKVLSVDKSPIKAAAIVTKVFPEDSNPDDEFGFSETITEFLTGYEPVSQIVSTTDSTSVTSDSTIITTDIQ
jgi:FlaG/FlaF family flagellin (archaellin)